MSFSQISGYSRSQLRCANACDNCKRRKEKCDGRKPCGRCCKRTVEWQCHFSGRVHVPRAGFPEKPTRISEHSPNTEDEDITHEHLPEAGRDMDMETVAPVPRLSRLIRHPSHKLIFLGDHANSSFFHCVRKVVQKAIGSCSLINDPHRNRLVDGMDVTPGDWLQQSEISLMLKPGHTDGNDLLNQFLWVSSGLTELLNKHEIKTKFPDWLKTEPAVSDSISAKYYLILALGAQTSRVSSDEMAESYFKCGRYLAMTQFMDKPSLIGVQCFLLITLYLIIASRRNAASMNFGIAIHSAHALGLHQPEMTQMFKADESQVRENTWKTLRTLDIFLSGSLGRPLATTETRSARDEKVSAVVGLAWITEFTLRKVYSQRTVSIATVKEIGKYHSNWVTQLPARLSHEGNSSSSNLYKDPRLNLGLLHLQNEQHVSIMLLTRPFLLDLAARASQQANAEEHSPSSDVSSGVSPDKALVYACVDSASHIVETLRPLLNDSALPKRLPFVVNAVFLAGIVLGLAFFANLRQHFPLYECLGDALKLLRLFSEHDIVAARGLSLLSDLESACRTYVANKDHEKYKSRRQLVAGLFGHFQPVDSALQTNSPVQGSNTNGTSTNMYDSVQVNETPDGSGTALSGMQDVESAIPCHVKLGHLPISSPPDTYNMLFSTSGGTEMMFHSNPPWYFEGMIPFGLTDENLPYPAQQFWETANIFSLD